MIKYEGLELFEDSYNFDESHALSWEVFEAEQDDTGTVDGVSILGRAIGPFFVVNGKSQNNRFYERRLWDRVLGEAGQTIGRGQMLGTIGHGQPLDDNALLEGKISHRISRLWIDEGKNLGMGEVLILNTPAGRTLNSYLRGGVQFPVSSRGYGKYNGKMEDGTQIVDSDTYKLETFDFVRVPGIPNAIPAIVENKDSINTRTKESKKIQKEEIEKTNSSPIIEDKYPPIQVPEKEKQTVTETVKKVYKMDDNVLQKMTEEKIRLEEELQRALDANSQLAETLDALRSANENLEIAVDEYRNLGSIEEISAVMDVTEGMLHNRPMEESDIAALAEALEVYEELGTPEELEELFDKFESFINSYDDLGSPDELHEALDRSVELLEAYNELGTPDEINEAFNGVESFMGEMCNVGTLEELHAVCDLLESYQEFGTPNELQTAFSMMDAVVENTRSRHIAAESRELASEYGVDASVAESMVESMGSNKAREVLGAINESRNITSRYRVEDRMNENGKQMNEDAPVRSVTSRTILSHDASSRATRLFEKMSR
jgi:hypothetical protein